MTRPRSNLLAHLLQLLLAGLLLSACPTTTPTFGEPDDDDTTDDPLDDDDVVDDDDATGDDDDAVQEAPILTVTGPLPAAAEVSGVLDIEFLIDDADSDTFTVDVLFQTDATVPTSATSSAATNPWEGTSGLVPTAGFAGTFDWDTLADIPTAAGGVRVQLCPVDAEGNAGDCQFYPPESEDPFDVDNDPVGNPGDLCAPGDVQGFDFTSGEAIVALSDGVCLNYEAPLFPIPTPTDFAAQFLVVVVNGGSADATFEITSATDPDDLIDTSTPSPSWESGPLGDLTSPRADEPAWRSLTRGFPVPRAAAAETDGPAFDDLPGIELEASTCAPSLTAADLHADIRDFKIRTELVQDPSDRFTVGATLRALGETVAIYVDNSTPLDVDYACNGVIDLPSPQPAEGFDNCDLDDIVDIVDANIAPTLDSLYGELPDVNGDCRVTVLVSHRMNSLTADLALPYMVRALAEPEVDLWAEDQALNPNSNQEEIIYAFAPDPLNIYNPVVSVPLDGYLNYQLAGQIAYAWQKLTSYSVHRGVGKTLLFADNPDHVAKPPAEEDWLDDGMGWLAADLTGFGAVIHRDSWQYLDGSHVQGLRENNTLEDFEDRGAQYLFARYLVDLYGPSVVWDILHAATTDPVGDLVPTQGVDSILIATAEPDFNELMVEWAAAMAVSGRLNDAVPPAQLVLSSDVRQYSAPTSVSVPDPTTPVVGELYGANGFQQGVRMQGFNHTYLNGLSAAGADEVFFLPEPTGSAGQPLHKVEGPDVLTFHPEREFYGSVAGLHGVVVVLISGLTQPENFLLIESSSDDLYGMVIRVDDYHPIPDIGTPDIPVTVEDSAATILTTEIPLGVLDPAGGERRIVGQIDASSTINLTPTGTFDLEDTDRYTLTLATTQRIGVWMDRRYSDGSGGISLTDPFVAVMPTSDVPDTSDYTQWNFGPTPSNGPCYDPALYSWPNTIPDWLSAQGDLIAEPIVSPGYEPMVAGDGAELPGAIACSEDHDQDGIDDLSEPLPSSLHEQIVQRQAENLLLDPAFYSGGFGDLPWDLDVAVPWFDETFIDVDSNEFLPNDLASAFPAYNVGGRAVEEGEDAVWQGLLPAGDYTIIAGDGSGSTGPYELSVRILPN